MIINPVTVKIARHELEAARRVIELAIANRATGKARRYFLEGALDAIGAALKADRKKVQWIATRNDTPLERHDPIPLRADGVTMLSFAYVADDGRIATQEPGQNPVLRNANAFVGVNIKIKENPA